MEIVEEALLKHVLWSAIERTVAKYDAKADFEAEDAVSNMTGNPAKIEAKMRAKKAEILAREQAEFRADLEKDGVDLKAPHEPSRSQPASASRSDPPDDRPVHRRAKTKGLPHRVLILCRTHRLADEARDSLPGGVTAAIWQGRKARQARHRTSRCAANIEAVKAALKIGAEVESSCLQAQGGALPVLRNSATIRRRRRRPNRPTSCSRRTKSCSRCRRRSARISAWSSSTRASGRTASPAPAWPSPAWTTN